MDASIFPCHNGSLYLEHNPHKLAYESVSEWIIRNDHDEHYDWVSDEEKQNAIKNNEIWTLQWYPDTPGGFNAIVASSLSALLNGVNKHA